MEENTLMETGEVNETETTEIVGVSDESFNRYMGSISYLLQVQVVGLGLIVGCLVCLGVMRWFHGH